MKRFCRWFGGGVVVLATALLAANFLYPMALGGLVWGGKAEDGRYFVVSKGHRYTEVSETQWQISQYVECAFPWVPVMLIWIGLGFRVAPDADREPAPRPSAKSAMGACVGAVVVAGGTGVLAVIRCYNTGVPWTIGLGVWFVLWGICFFLVCLHARSTHPQSGAEPLS